MPGIDYRALRAAVSLEQVLELLRFKPTRRLAHKLRGPCPIHDSNGTGGHRCFSVDLEAGKRQACIAQHHRDTRRTAFEIMEAA